MTMKNLYWIRHGYAEHNDVFKQIGEKAYFSIRDSNLLFKGIQEATELSKNIPNNIELVLISPLSRTLETAHLIFNTQIQEKDQKINFIVLDELLEYPQGLHICNKRQTKTYLNAKYPKFDINIPEEITWNNTFETYEELDKRIAKLYEFVRNCSEIYIAIVTHNSYIRRALSITDEIEHCQIITEELK